MSELILNFLAVVEEINKLPFDIGRDAKKVAYWHRKRLVMMYAADGLDRFVFKARPNRIGAPFPCQTTDYVWQGIVELDTKAGHSSPTTRIRAGIMR